MNFRPHFTTDVKDSDQKTFASIQDYMIKARDLITFREDQLIEEVIDTMIDRQISGGPVLDSNNKLIGIISEKDCLRIIVDQAYHNLPGSSRKVADYMTRDVKTISAASTIVDAADAFLNSPVRRIPILDNGILIGQVSRRDILRAAKDIQPTTW